MSMPDGLEAAGGEGLVEAELVEDLPGVRADLQAGAEFGNDRVALEHDDRGAELGQRQGQRQAG